MSADLEKRLLELETKASFQEASIEDMSGVIAQQDARIGRLETTVRALRDRLKDFSGEGLGPLPENEKPPHY